MQDLGTLGGAASEAFGINAGGQVVGKAQRDNGEEHAFLKNPGQDMQDLGTLGGTFSDASGINVSGQVVGNSDTGTGQWLAFIKEPGEDMEPIIGWTTMNWALDINDAGQVVGGMLMGGIHVLAFIWSREGPSDYWESQLGGVQCEARGINRSGQVVGWAEDADGFQRAFLKDPGQPMLDLGTLGGNNGVAFGINGSGQVVGTAAITNGELRAFWWEKGTMYDLNALAVNLPAGVVLESARDINDGGWIIGTFATNRSFLLKPVALPPLLLLLVE
jgi:probable HAF family extracellular repeat protein